MDFLYSNNNNTLVNNNTKLLRWSIIASHDTVLHLVKSKCLPILLYGLEVLPLNKAQLRSLDFVVNRFFMKLFKTNNIQTVEFYRDQFNFELPSHQITVRYAKFLNTITPDIGMFTTCI